MKLNYYEMVLLMNSAFERLIDVWYLIIIYMYNIKRVSTAGG